MHRSMGTLVAKLVTAVRHEISCAWSAGGQSGGWTCIRHPLVSSGLLTELHYGTCGLVAPCTWNCLCFPFDVVVVVVSVGMIGV